MTVNANLTNFGARFFFSLVFPTSKYPDPFSLTEAQVVAAMSDYLNAPDKAEYASLTSLSQIPPTANAQLQMLANDLADYGYTYNGPSTNLAGSVATQIADYFGFDPDSGKDIAPPSGG